MWRYIESAAANIIIGGKCYFEIDCIALFDIILKIKNSRIT